ncbi:hypothetical protein ACWD4G_00050 [Streptomyces sp. NPDC002643]
MNDSVPEREARAEAVIPEGEVPATETVVPAMESNVPAVEAEAPEAVVEDEYDPAAPAPLNVPRPATGHPEVDAALARLTDADHLATDGHVEVYEDVHRGLRDTLTALDARPGPSAPPAPSPYPHDRRS